MFTQLNPPLPVHVEERGDGYAVAVIDYGPEHSLIWVTALSASGELWCAPNSKVRMHQNWTLGRHIGRAGRAPDDGHAAPTNDAAGDQAGCDYPALDQADCDRLAQDQAPGDEPAIADLFSKAAA